jgi:hypothetical protein
MAACILPGYTHVFLCCCSWGRCCLSLSITEFYSRTIVLVGENNDVIITASIFEVSGPQEDIRQLYCDLMDLHIFNRSHFGGC